MADAPQVPLQPKKVRISMPRGPSRFVTKVGFIKVLKVFAESLGISIQIDGAQWSTQTPDGGAFRILPSGKTIDHPWKGTVKDGAFTCLGGYVNTIKVDDTEVIGTDGYAYLELSFDLDREDDFVYGGTLTAASVAFNSDVPEDDEYGGYYFVPLFQFENSRVISQSAYQHALATICDNGSGEGEGYLNLIQI